MTAPAPAPTRNTPSAAAVTGTYLAASAELRSRLLGIVIAAYTAQGNYGDAAAAAFAAQVVPVVLAAQHTMVSLTEAYLTHLIATVLHTTTAPKGIPLREVTGEALRGVGPATVYQRPFIQVRTDLSRGKPFLAAVAAGQRRATDLAATDLQLARTHTAQRVMAGTPQGVIGYRRDLGPGTKHCALCLLTSSRIYHKSELLPIHPGCSCAATPVFEGEHIPELDPSLVHDTIRRDLGDKYVQAGGRGPVDYRDIVITHHHGELGEVLGVRGQHFTGPADIPGGERG